MEAFLDWLIKALDNQSDAVLYGVLFLSAVVENLFPPIPGDTITVFGAFLVGTKRLSYSLVYLSTTAGSVVGFMALFFVGRFLEREFFLDKNYKFFSRDSIIKAEAWFGRYGYWVVLGNRFLPGVRSVISIVSGITMLHPVKVFCYSLVSAALWNLIWIQAGFMLGDKWDIVKKKSADILATYNIAVGIILTLFVAVYFGIKLYRKRKDSV